MFYALPAAQMRPSVPAPRGTHQIRLMCQQGRVGVSGHVSLNLNHGPVNLNQLELPGVAGKL